MRFFVLDAVRCALVLEVGLNEALLSRFLGGNRFG